MDPLLTTYDGLWAEQVRSHGNFGVKSDIPRVLIAGGEWAFERWHADTFWLDLYAGPEGGARIVRLWPQRDADGGSYFHADPMHCLR